MFLKFGVWNAEPIIFFYYHFLFVGWRGIALTFLLAIEGLIRRMMNGSASDLTYRVHIEKSRDYSYMVSWCIIILLVFHYYPSPLTIHKNRLYAENFCHSLSW